MKYVAGVCVLILLASCTSPPEAEVPEEYTHLENLTAFTGDPQPRGEISLTREVTYRDTEEAVLGQSLTGLEVDPEGRVYIGDRQAFTVHVFLPDGSYLRGVGRKGKGPGEFTGLMNIEVANGKLATLNFQTSRLSEFDLDGFEHLGDYELAIEANDNKPSWLQRTRDNRTAYRPQEIYRRPDGNYLVIFYDPGVAVESNLYNRTYELSAYSPSERNYSEHNLLSFDWTGRVLFQKRDNGIHVMHDVPYKRASAYSFHGGTLVQGWTEDLLLKFHDVNGNYRKAWYYPVPEHPLTLEQALAMYPSERVEESIRGDDLPETWPAFHSVLLDDEGRLWVSRATGSPHNLDWWVLGPSGELLAEFEWSRHDTFEEVQDGKLYVTSMDTSTYAMSAARYDIEFE